MNAARCALFCVLLLATLPATLWELFPLFYYGFLFPNTAYAKVLSADFPLAHKWNLGIKYLRCSIGTDALGFITLLLAAVLAARRRQLTALLSLAATRVLHSLTATRSTGLAAWYTGTWGAPSGMWWSA